MPNPDFWPPRRSPPGRSPAIAVVMISAVALAACDTSSSTGPGDPGCESGVARCAGRVHEICRDGAFVAVDSCAIACHDVLGCLACVPDEARCAGDVSTYCRPDGTGVETEACDPVQGVTCDAESGRCTGACSRQSLGRSYIGCEYFPVVTANLVDPSFPYGVSVSNTADDTARVTIEGGALSAPLVFDVPGHDVVVQPLPWVSELKAPASARVAAGAYHLRSTRPVTVYQFNPIDFERGGVYSVTNDASLLLPANALGRRYAAAAYDHHPFSPGWLSITGTADDTLVTIVPRSATLAGVGAPALAAGVSTTFVLARGAVVQLAGDTGDVTGTLIEATSPIQVLGGHHCTKIPITVDACDHLEESMFPIESLSTTYVVASPAVPTLPDGKVQLVRIVATAPATTLAYDPPQPGAPTSLTAAGDFAELPLTAASFQVTANHKILVAQYMTGQDAGGDMGDPDLSLAVATDQFRSEYLFHAPLSYTTNYVNVVAPIGAAIVLDGAAVTGFAPIGGSGFSLARVELVAGARGNHFITGDVAFGISVYGYGIYTSYWYPGGTELREIILAGSTGPAPHT